MNRELDKPGDAMCPRPERRQFGRRATCIHAWVIFTDRPRLPCLVRNLSRGGALIEMRQDVVLPYLVKLRIDPIGFFGVCEIKHQEGRRIGVFFRDGLLDLVEPVVPGAPKPTGGMALVAARRERGA